MTVGVEEYLATSYRPDRDYVDGVLEERPLGRRDHSGIQSVVPIWFWIRRDTLHLKAYTGQRVRVSPHRYRVPDICVVPLPAPDEQVFTKAPYIVLEILSPDDGFPKLQERLDDYFALGVPNLWVLDPTSRRCWRIVHEGHLEALDGVLRTADGRVELPIAELFALDAR